ncbi:hypothetical protein JAAARDRAFT_34560 [Jaapia argillacea MUCL 33604]|uniref:Tim44-like domain-containing protein n=1 Tax=Jaapia argillacea MUCL 33604 TaxID=933084 RepID=A0A067PXV0_9AGAM|nr:hypothetical protein JAAARDRAFT_34560 [Jaapia argillacea MUCL 33604]
MSCSRASQRCLEHLVSRPTRSALLGGVSQSKFSGFLLLSRHPSASVPALGATGLLSRGPLWSRGYASSVSDRAPSPTARKTKASAPSSTPKSKKATPTPPKAASTPPPPTPTVKSPKSPITHLLSKVKPYINHPKQTVKPTPIPAGHKPPHTSPSSPAAPSAPLVLEHVEPPPKEKLRKNHMTSTRAPATDVEGQLREVEQLMALSSTGGGFDPWAHPSQLLDVYIPVPYSERSDATWKDHWNAFMRAQGNKWRNMFSLYRLAKENGIPNQNITKYWSRQLFKTTSTEPDAWSAPFRQIALDSYKQVGEALAKGDEKTLKRLTGYSYQDHVLKLVRKRDPKHPRVIQWEFKGEKKPCQVLSLRVEQGHMGKDEVKIGNKYMVQALVKFDTIQTLQTFTRDGTLLTSSGQISLDQKAAPRPRNVVEYMVFEKKMWYDTPWIIRDQIYPGVEVRLKSADEMME